MKSSGKKISYWLAFMLCFSGIPSLLVIYGFLYLNNQQKTINLEKHQAELFRLYKVLEPITESEPFWCNFLTTRLNQDVIKAAGSDAAILEK